jgi:hypothetical protein
VLPQLWRLKSLLRSQIDRFPECTLAEALRNDEFVRAIRISLSSKEFERVHELFTTDGNSLGLEERYDAEIRSSLNYLNLPKQLVADAEARLIISNLLPEMLNCSHKVQIELRDAVTMFARWLTKLDPGFPKHNLDSCKFRSLITMS